MKRFRVFFNESIITTLEAESEEEARDRFLGDTMREIDMWYDFEEVPSGSISQPSEISPLLPASLKPGSSSLPRHKT